VVAVVGHVPVIRGQFGREELLELLAEGGVFWRVVEEHGRHPTIRLRGV